MIMVGLVCDPYAW